jgi:hypothetical protein
MRVEGAVVTGLSVLLAVACCGCGGTTSSGTTGGTATTGGTSATGGTTGTMLAAGADCSSNAQCQSGLCGIAGSGKCCSSACLTADPTCGATACDATGTCVYPGAVHCSTDSCSAGMLTQSNCSGSGTCTQGTPAACPNHQQCKTATSCDSQCSTPTDCVSGYTCDTATHQCVAKRATGACVSSDACASGVCGIHGSGNCCSAACATSDATCGATACDATGACVYPSAVPCGTSSCNAGMLTNSTCNGSGSCTSGSPAACASNFACNDGGTACLSTCSVVADCVRGFYCKAHACIARKATGVCTTNDACSSGLCGASGLGHCCTSACPASDPVCGITDCDATGACVYANGFTLCAVGCTGDTYSSPTYCDGTGRCPPPVTQVCAPYACAVSGCLQSCGANTDCSSGNFCCASSFCPTNGACFAGCHSTADCQSGQFCEVGGGNCCGALSSGATLLVDAVTGSDAACCGYGSNGACQTLSKAMELIDSAAAKNVTIAATVDGGGGDWAAPEASYPIVLGWGVELNAPGVFVFDPNGGHSAILDVNFYSANDTVGYASIVGTAANPAGVGMNAANTQQTSDGDALAIESGNSLYIANAIANGSANNGSWAIEVKAGGGLWLGEDHGATISGTVYIGNALGQTNTDGNIGIYCDSDYANLVGCTIEDATLPAGQSGVVIQGQEALDIYGSDFATITLTANPIIGVPPSAAGFGKCLQKKDGLNFSTAIYLPGLETVTLKNATIQCVAGDGLYLQGSRKGTPTVTLDSTTIQNTDLAIYASAGTAAVTTSTFQFNFRGVQQDTDGTNNAAINLSGGGNAVICSSNVESSQGSTSPGIDVYNTSAVSLKADDVAWDTSGPDYFLCDSAFAACICNLASCALDGGSNGMAAVENSDAGITTTNNTQSAFVLDAGCG